MGEYAEYALANYARSGMKYNPNYGPRTRPRCSCGECHKEVEASEGLAAHIKMKHN